jgi:hypothetical protein
VAGNALDRIRAVGSALENADTHGVSEMTEKPEVGDRVETWFSGRADGKSTVLAVEPYRGRYTQHFAWTVRVTAPNTNRGWMELCVAASEVRP